MAAIPTSRRTGAAIALAACLSLAAPAAAPAEDRLPLQGLFCNTEAQLDRALDHIARGRSPSAAAENLNHDAVVCTYVDLVAFLIERPISLGGVPLARHRGTLVAVAVGDSLRPVTPPVEVFFVTPKRVSSARFEHRT